MLTNYQGITVYHRHLPALEHYILRSFVVMSNHVHLLISPSIPLLRLWKSLKSITAKRANELLELTGQPFWQEESYDRLVRNKHEFERIQRYIEMNPVRAGLVLDPEQFRWSSARATWGSPADQGVRLT